MATLISILLHTFLLISANFVLGNPRISLGYDPYPLPSYNPNPGSNTAHTVPPGKPWPANPEDYNTFSQTTTALPPAWPAMNQNRPTVDNRFQETTSPQNNFVQQKPVRPERYPIPGQLLFPEDLWLLYASDVFSVEFPSSTLESRLQDTGNNPSGVVLDYKPIAPSYRPNPVDLVGQIVSPGQPWPANPADYATFGQSSSSQIQTVQNRFPGITTPNSVKPQVILDYDPNRPTFHPNPTADLVAPGRPWAANPDHYNKFNSVPSVSTQSEQIGVNCFQGTSTTGSSQVKPHLILDYKPNRPSYRPNPTDLVGQKVPPGKPWPANTEDYNTFNQRPSVPIQNPQTVENRVQETSTTETNQVKPQLVLDYKPNPQPSYRPNATDLLGQIVPPGKPWPSNQEDYGTFNQNQNENTTKPGVAEKPPPEVVGQIIPPGKPLPANVSQDELQQTTMRPQENKTQAPLEYYPVNSINQGTAIGVIVRPGKPWPANPEDYNSFSQVTSGRTGLSDEQNNSGVILLPEIIENVEVQARPIKPEQRVSDVAEVKVPQDIPKPVNLQAVDTANSNGVTDSLMLYTSKALAETVPSTLPSN